jgi:3-phenylpropionate/trans-cinnamate dioxygenase ferredoxin reductase component
VIGGGSIGSEIAAALAMNGWPVTTVVEWEEPNRKGAVYYLDAARQPRGVLLWNVFGRVEPARGLIGAHRSIEMGTLGGPVR